MNTKLIRLIAITAMPAALLAITSCSSTPKGSTEATSTVETSKGVPGGKVQNTYRSTATVVAVDPVTRHVTLKTWDGKTKVIKAGPEVVNFNQIQPGDKVVATMTEQLVVAMAPPGSAGTGSPERTMATGPYGDKPGMKTTDTIETSAKVVGINKSTREASLQFSDGTIHPVTVRPDVDLSKVSVGQQVMIRSTEETAIHLEKP
jgi:hypothetical protein